MSVVADVCISWYQKKKWWPCVLHGLIANKANIGKVIISADERWGGWIPEAPGSGLTIQLLERDHVGWGAGRVINEAVKHVTTPYFLHLDGDQMLGVGALATSLRYMDDVSLLAGKVHNTSDDAHLEDVSTKENGGGRGTEKVLAARVVMPDQRDVGFRTPLPLNLRHGHFLAHTDKWLPHPCEEFQVDGEDAYFSMDYVLAARWIMAHGEESFAFGGGAAYHLGGHYVAAQEAETDENKRRVRAYLDRYVAHFKEGPHQWNLEA